jgi:hypothetical protein
MRVSENDQKGGLPHALLRYGDLTASGIAGGRTGLNVDSAVARAATKSDEKINTIFALNDCTVMACSGQKDLRNNR